VAFTGTDYDDDSEWHMYTITYDGHTIRGYKDGASVAALGNDVPFIGDPDNPLDPPGFAETLVDTDDMVHVGGTSEWQMIFAGGVDEYTIWDDTLSAGAIRGLFDNNVIPEPTSLMLLLMAGGALVLYRR
jgi:hypothetical protein